MLEKHRVRCEVLRLTGNLIGNEGSRCIVKYLTSFGQAPVSELHLSRNKVTGEGLKWLLAGLSMHPAFPIWSAEQKRFVPLRVNVEHNKVKGEATYKTLEAACQQFTCSVCLGDSVSSEMCKTNCTVHLRHWEMPADAMPLPTPELHTRPIFAPCRKAAPVPLPPGVTDPVRTEPRVLYEDEDLAVVLKPPGWSCVPNPKGISLAWARLRPQQKRQQVGELLQQSAAVPLQAWLLMQFGGEAGAEAAKDLGKDCGMAHRLDADTSGPILVGKTIKGFEHARKQVVVGILKDYVALVQGTFNTERGEVSMPIDPTPFAQTKRVRVGGEGQPATTVWEAVAEYESVDRKERYTLVHCRMVTLRTQQLRAHMQHLGHPLVGDQAYSSGAKPAWCPRMFMHKSRIGFMNMKGQAVMESCSLQAAPDLWKTLAKLRKVGGMAMMGCGAPGL